MRESTRILLGALLTLAFAATPALAAERTFRANALDQIVEVTDSFNPAIDATFTYDENGNRKTKTQGGVTTTYRWDARDRLIEVLRDGTWLAQYDYDADGLRIEKVVRGSPNSTLTRFQYDGSRLQSEANALNNTLATYYRDNNGKLLGFQRNGQSRSIISDGQGTPVAILSPQGAVLGRFVYDPWGGLLEATGTESVPIRYTGYYYDEETGLYYAGARYYDPAIGGFISRDPVDGDVERPITQNKYIAFNANPGTYQDPTGRCGLAMGDASECINNVAAVEGWSTDRWQEELGIQSAAEDRSAPGKLLGMATTMTGLGLSRAVGAGIQTFKQFQHFGYAAAVATHQGAPYAEQALELASGTPGSGTSTVPNLAALESRGARAASAAADVSDVPLPPGFSRAMDDVPTPGSNSATAMVVMESPNSLQSMLVPTRSSPASAAASIAAGRPLADAEMQALRGAGLTDVEISGRMQASGDILLFRGTSLGWEGNPVLQKLDLSPASLDPVVATVFALESRVYGGRPVLHYGPRSAFGQDLTLGNIDPVRRSLEREVYVGVNPKTFGVVSPHTASADAAREVLATMGYNLPSRIQNTGDATALLHSLPRMNPQQVQTFMERMAEKQQGGR